MTESSATPNRLTAGAWTFEHDLDGDFVILAGTELIAVTNLDSETDEANARLIAAAPDAIGFIRRQYASLNCICKGPIGRVQNMMGTDVPCHKCEAGAILKKAGIAND